MDLSKVIGASRTAISPTVRGHLSLANSSGFDHRLPVPSYCVSGGGSLDIAALNASYAHSAARIAHLSDAIRNNGTNLDFDTKCSRDFIFIGDYIGQGIKAGCKYLITDRKTGESLFGGKPVTVKRIHGGVREARSQVIFQGPNETTPGLVNSIYGYQHEEGLLFLLYNRLCPIHLAKPVQSEEVKAGSANSFCAIRTKELSPEPFTDIDQMLPQAQYRLTLPNGNSFLVSFKQIDYKIGDVVCFRVGLNVPEVKVKLDGSSTLTPTNIKKLGHVLIVNLKDYMFYRNGMETRVIEGNWHPELITDSLNLKTNCAFKTINQLVLPKQVQNMSLEELVTHPVIQLASKLSKQYPLSSEKPPIGYFLGILTPEQFAEGLMSYDNSATPCAVSSIAEISKIDINLALSYAGGMLLQTGLPGVTAVRNLFPFIRLLYYASLKDSGITVNAGYDGYKLTASGQDLFLNGSSLPVKEKVN